MFVPILQMSAGIMMSWTGYIYLDDLLSVLSVMFGVLLTTAGLGMFQVSVFHYCAHYTLLGSRSANRRMGRLVSAVVFLGDFDTYRAKHMRHHNRQTMLDEEDEFTEFLHESICLVPGVPKSNLWTQVIRCTLSPSFHIKFFLMRLVRSNVKLDTVCWLSMSAWLAALFTVDLTQSWGPFLISVVVPLLVTFQISIVLRTLCEHVVPAGSLRAKRPRDFVSHASRAVYAGVAPPAKKLTEDVAAWALWSANMITLQLFFRVVILVGDAACHDVHHRNPGSRDWPNYMVARCKEYRERNMAGKEPFPEVWGLFATIDTCLATVASSRFDWEERLVGSSACREPGEHQDLWGAALTR